MRAQEAHELVAALPGRRRGEGRGVGTGLRHSERELLRLLLRCTRNDAGDVGFQRGTKWLADELGYSSRSIERARGRLVHLELVEVVRRGTGDSRSLYRVAMERIRATEAVQDQLPPGDAPVHPHENSLPAEVAGSQPCRPPADTVPTLHRNGVDPYTRARSFLEVPGRKNPPNPPPALPAGGTTSATTDCPRARQRGEPCADCRHCGTTRRQLKSAARAAAKAAGQMPACGRCDPITRLEELDGGTVRRCPTCHPNRDQVAAAIGDDQPDRWAREHLADLGVSKTQTRREAAG